LVILTTAPMLWGLLSRLRKHNHLFADFLQLSCAAARTGAHQPLFSGAPCEGMDAMPFVYIPLIAHGAAALTGALGPFGFSLLYVLVYIAAGFYLGWVLVFSKAVVLQLVERAPLMTLITGSALSWGNIALPLTALIVGAANAALTLPIGFGAAVAVAAVFKPVFLVYLLGLLYAPVPLMRRALVIGGSALCGLAPTLTFLVFGGEEARQWTAQTLHYVLVQAPGYGFLGWMAALGVSGVGPVVAGLFMLYALVIVVSGWIVATQSGLPDRDRVWLGLGAAALLIPRLMRYDAFLLGLGLIVLAQAARALSPRHGRTLSIAVYGLLALSWVLNFAVGGNLLLLVTPLFSLLLVGVAAWCLQRRLRQETSPIRCFWTPPLSRAKRAPFRPSASDPPRTWRSHALVPKIPR
jgi:hypothetical protein